MRLETRDDRTKHCVKLSAVPFCAGAAIFQLVLFGRLRVAERERVCARVCLRVCMRARTYFHASCGSSFSRVRARAAAGARDVIQF